MTVLSYIQAGEPVTGQDMSDDGVANRVTRQILSLSGLNPDSDFPGFLVNGISGTGDTNFLPRFTGTTTVGNSSISDDGTNIVINPSGSVTIKGFDPQSSLVEINDGNSGTALTVNFNPNLNHKTTLTGACTFTFTAPANGEVVILKMLQDATGGRIVTWPSSVNWGSALEPVWDTTATKINIAVFYFDGTTYWGKSLILGA